MQVGWNAHADVLWFGVPSCRNGWGFGKMFCIWFACSFFCVSHGLRKDTYVHEKRVWGVSRRICAYAPTRIVVFILLKTNNTTRSFDKNFLRDKMNFSDKNLFSEEHSSPPRRICAYLPSIPFFRVHTYLRIQKISPNILQNQKQSSHTHSFVHVTKHFALSHPSPEKQPESLICVHSCPESQIPA